MDARGVSAKDVIAAISDITRVMRTEGIDRFTEGNPIRVSIDGANLEVYLRRGILVLYYDNETLRCFRCKTYAILYSELSDAILKEQEERCEEDLPF